MGLLFSCTGVFNVMFLVLGNLLFSFLGIIILVIKDYNTPQHNNTLIPLQRRCFPYPGGGAPLAHVLATTFCSCVSSANVVNTKVRKERAHQVLLTFPMPLYVATRLKGFALHVLLLVMLCVV